MNVCHVDQKPDLFVDGDEVLDDCVLAEEGGPVEAALADIVPVFEVLLDLGLVDAFGRVIPEDFHAVLEDLDVAVRAGLNVKRRSVPRKIGCDSAA